MNHALSQWNRLKVQQWGRDMHRKLIPFLQMKSLYQGAETVRLSEAMEALIFS